MSTLPDGAPPQEFNKPADALKKDWNESPSKQSGDATQELSQSMWSEISAQSGLKVEVKKSARTSEKPSGRKTAEQIEDMVKHAVEKNNQVVDRATDNYNKELKVGLESSKSQLKDALTMADSNLEEQSRKVLPEFARRKEEFKKAQQDTRYAMDRIGYAADNCAGPDIPKLKLKHYEAWLTREQVAAIKQAATIHVDPRYTAEERRDADSLLEERGLLDAAKRVDQTIEKQQQLEKEIGLDKLRAGLELREGTALEYLKVLRLTGDKATEAKVQDIPAWREEHLNITNWYTLDTYALYGYGLPYDFDLRK